MYFFREGPSASSLREFLAAMAKLKVALGKYIFSLIRIDNASNPPPLSYCQIL